MTDEVAVVLLLLAGFVCWFTAFAFRFAETRFGLALDETAVVDLSGRQGDRLGANSAWIIAEERSLVCRNKNKRESAKPQMQIGNCIML